MRVMLAPGSSLRLLPSWPALHTLSQDARNTWFLQGSGVAPSHRVLELGGSPCPTQPSPSLLTSCPLGTGGHSRGLCHQALRGGLWQPRSTGPAVPHCRKLPLRGPGGPTDICKPPVRALLRLCSSVPRLALPPPACTLCCGCPVGRGLGAHGGWGRAAQGALGQPLPILCGVDAFVFVPLHPL